MQEAKVLSAEPVPSTGHTVGYSSKSVISVSAVANSVIDHRVRCIPEMFRSINRLPRGVQYRNACFCTHQDFFIYAVGNQQKLGALSFQSQT